MKLRGVNLGNWLSLEKWMQPEMFEGFEGEDEMDFFENLSREEAFSRLHDHYENYITEYDFAFLAEAGANLVRIPIPYYIYGEEDRPASIEYLDRAFEWGDKYGIKILIDLHSVRGGQNGFDNSGCCGLCTWHKHPEYVEETLQLLEKLAKRYSAHPALFGIGPLNEPANWNLWQRNVALYKDIYPERVAQSEAVPDDFLRQFYMDCYHRLRPLLPDDAIIVLADQFELSRWEDFMPKDEYPGVWIDAHKYLIFSEGMFEYEGLPLEGAASAYSVAAGDEKVQGGLILQNYLRLIRDVFAKDVLRAAQFHPIMVGEWSMVQNMEDIKNAESDSEVRELYRQLADAHIETWDQVEGGAYWVYKVTDEEHPAWDFCKCVKNGWLSYR